MLISYITNNFPYNFVFITGFPSPTFNVFRKTKNVLFRIPQNKFPSKFAPITGFPWPTCTIIKKTQNGLLFTSQKKCSLTFVSITGLKNRKMFYSVYHNQNVYWILCAYQDFHRQHPHVFKTQHVLFRIHVFT